MPPDVVDDNDNISHALNSKASETNDTTYISQFRSVDFCWLTYGLPVALLGVYYKAVVCVDRSNPLEQEPEQTTSSTEQGIHYIFCFVLFVFAFVVNLL